ncbi:MAG: hypothetical protein AB1568_11600 [Thermodesulfobacteriota bacterium]
MTIWRTFSCVVILFCAVGCTTVYQIPPSLTAEQRLELESSPYSQLVIGIDTEPGMHDGKYFPEYVIDDFKILFSRSGLFKQVDITSALKTTPDLIVDLRSGVPPAMCATGEASVMIMTLGIVPLRGRDNRKYSFTIANPNNSKALDLEFTYIAKSYFGSVSSLMSKSSNWSISPQDEKNYELFAYELVSKKDEILGLIKER